jgi:hypothetical protein
VSVKRINANPIRIENHILLFIESLLGIEAAALLRGPN